MKREIKDIHFYQCPTTEIDVPRDTRVHHEPVMPIIPQNGDGFQESAEPISQGDKAKKVLKIAAIFTIAALFIGLVLSGG